MPLFSEYDLASALLAIIDVLLNWSQSIAVRNKVLTEIDKLVIGISIDVGFALLLELEFSIFLLSLTLFFSLLSVLFSLFVLFFLLQFSLFVFFLFFFPLLILLLTLFEPFDLLIDPFNVPNEILLVFI